MGYYPTSDAMDWITDDDRGREINGRGGNDQFYGGAGNDVLIGGGSGRNTLYGQVGDDVLHGGDHNDTLSGGANDDLLLWRRRRDRIFGGRLGKDTLYGRQPAMTTFARHHGRGTSVRRRAAAAMTRSTPVTTITVAAIRIFMAKTADDDLRGGDLHDSLFGGQGNNLYGRSAMARIGSTAAMGADALALEHPCARGDTAWRGGGAPDVMETWASFALEAGEQPRPT